MPTAEETQAAAAAMAASNPPPPPYVQPQAPSQPPPAPPQNGQQPPQVGQPGQPHPDFSKPPAQPGDTRSPNIWIKPEEWTAQQARLQSLEEYKSQQDKLLEMKEAERLRAMAEKGQVEEAFKEMKKINEGKLSELQTQLAARERAWLQEKTTQTVNEVLAGRQWIGKDAEARTRMAALVRRSLEAEIESVIGPNGVPIVRDRVTLRPAIDYLKERLDSPDSEFQSLLAPTKQPSGGSGTDGTRPPATPNTPPPVAMSPDETVKAWQATKQSVPSFGLFPQQRKA